MKVTEAELRQLLASDAPLEGLRQALEDLARGFQFARLTWLWGPELYKRHRVLFRPFILRHFSPWGFIGLISWKKHQAELEPWLAEVERHDDTALFGKLIEWKFPEPKKLGAELVRRLGRAADATAKVAILAKFARVRLALDEAAALAIHHDLGAGAEEFLVARAAFAQWPKLIAAARLGSPRLAERLYRRQADAKTWRKDALALAARVGAPEALYAALAAIEPERAELGRGMVALLEKRGADVEPYVFARAERAFGSWWQSGLDDAIKLARKVGLIRLWTALVRLDRNPKRWNRAIMELLDDASIGPEERRRRLAGLAGPSRQISWGGWGLAAIQPLDEEVALRLYQLEPALTRHLFKAHLQIARGEDAIHRSGRLLGLLIADGEHDLLDFLASRLVTRPHADAGIRLLEAYYRDLDPRRAAAVLGQIPAFAIADDRRLLRENPLAQLLFGQAGERFLDDATALRDLVEGAEIHVMTLAYRLLGRDDPRARRLAAENLDMLLPTLLRPLHRRTRTVAWRALENAATDLAKAARIVAKAREATRLPDKKYPKEALIGLLGRLLHRFPALRSPEECPRVYGPSAAEAPCST